MEAITFLAAPLCVCLLLVGIHCYLGLHILAREVIFVDLALAQIAALGTILAYLIGFEHHSAGAYLISLGAGFVTALFLTFVNRLRNVSHEAVIGLVYAFGAAAVVLLVDKMSHGAEHLKYALVGKILWVSWHDVLWVLAIYACVACIHFIFRKPLLKSSLGKETNWKWDLLFYSLFVVVITSSVNVAGVLLVFSFLIVPALVGNLFCTTVKTKLFFGWTFGLVLVLLGLCTSYFFDLPTSPLLVLLMTTSAALIIMWKAVMK